MSTALHLARIERLCARDFPEQHGRSGLGPAGPRYHLVELDADRGPEECEEDADPALREAMAEQCEAERDGLTQVLKARWGEPETMGLQGVLLRAWEYGEHIPEPWASLSACVPDVRLWHTAGRWVALGVARLDPARPPRLVATVTDIDPP